MEYVNQAIETELSRINNMDSIPEVKSMNIARLKDTVNRIHMVNKIQFPNDNDTYTYKIKYLNRKNEKFRFSPSIGRTKNGLGLTLQCKSLSQEKTMLATATFNTFNTYNFALKFILPELDKLNLSYRIIPGYTFGVQRQKFDYLNQDFRAYSFKMLKDDIPFSHRIRVINYQQVGRSRSAPANILADPNQYNVLTYSHYFSNLWMLSKASLGIVSASNEFQPFYRHEITARHNFDDNFSVRLFAGNIFSRNGLPIFERFYNLSPWLAENVSDKIFGVDNGSYISPCDHYFSGDFSAKFYSGKWTIHCNLRYILAGLYNPRGNEIPGTQLYAYAGIRIIREIWGKKVSFGIFHPLNKMQTLKTVPLSLQIVDDF